MKKKGYTLIELIIAFSIFVIFSGFMYKVYFEQIRSLKSIGSKSQIQYNANTAMDLISRQIRNNVNITGNAQGICTQLTIPGTVLIDVSGNGINSNLYFDSITSTLRDRGGNILCNGIQDIIMNLQGKYIEITIDLKSSKETYSIITGFTIN